jgi:hypothetical protein
MTYSPAAFFSTEPEPSHPAIGSLRNKIPWSRNCTPSDDIAPPTLFQSAVVPSLGVGKGSTPQDAALHEDR